MFQQSSTTMRSQSCTFYLLFDLYGKRYPSTWTLRKAQFEVRSAALVRRRSQASFLSSQPHSNTGVPANTEIQTTLGSDPRASLGMANLGRCLNPTRAIETPTKSWLLLKHRRANHHIAELRQDLGGHHPEEKDLSWRKSVLEQRANISSQDRRRTLHARPLRHGRPRRLRPPPPPLLPTNRRLPSLLQRHLPRLLRERPREMVS